MLLCLGFSQVNCCTHVVVALLMSKLCTHSATDSDESCGGTSPLTICNDIDFLCAWHGQKSMPFSMFSIHSKSKPSKFTFQAKY